MAENKNPYEVRLEVLKTARDLVLDRYYQRKENWVELTRALQEKQHTNSVEYEVALKKVSAAPPEFPSEDDVLKTARELYTFVTSKE